MRIRTDRLATNIDESRSPESTRKEEKDPVEINKIIKKAKRRFVFLLRQVLMHNLESQTYDQMFDILNLTLINKKKAIEEIKKLIKATKNIRLTETGFIVSNMELFKQNPELKDTKDRIMKVFTDNPNGEFTSADIKNKLNLDDVSYSITQLCREGKITVIRTEIITNSKTGQSIQVYKLAT